MDLERRIRDIFPPAERARRVGLNRDISAYADELLSLASEADFPITFRVVTENDRDVLTYYLDGRLGLTVRLVDRYPYFLRLLMAHLAVRLNGESSDGSPYEGRGELDVVGRRVAVEFHNAPGHLCLHLAPVPALSRTTRALADVA